METFDIGIHKVLLTFGTVVNGVFAPDTGLINGVTVRFIRADDSTVISAGNMTELGNGKYQFWNFSIPAINFSSASADYQGCLELIVQKWNGSSWVNQGGTVRTYRNSSQNDGYDDYPPSRAFVENRLDRQGDTLFGWASYDNVNWHGSTGLNDPGDYNLVHKKYVYDKDAERVDRAGDTLFGWATYDHENWNGATPLAEPGDYNLIHKKYVYDKDAERVDRAGDTIQGWITIDRENWNGSTNYDDPSDYNLVYKKWIIDNFPVSGQSGNFWKINTNRLIVDSRVDKQYTEKIYFKIQDAIAYASTQTLSATSRWEIFIFPHHSSGYAEDITLPRWVSLIGIGKVVVAGGLEIAQPENWINYDAKIENLIFKVNNKGYNIRQLRVNDCLFHANGVSGEVNLIINGSQCNNSGFFVQNDVNLETLNTNKINRIQGCYGNTEITWQAQDKVYSYDYVEGDLWE